MKSFHFCFNDILAGHIDLLKKHSIENTRCSWSLVEWESHVVVYLKLDIAYQFIFYSIASIFLCYVAVKMMCFYIIDCYFNRHSHCN